MEVRIIKEKISEEELKKIAQDGFGTVVKIAVDVEKEIMAVGGEWHSECQEALVESGSSSKDVWGVNIHLWKPREEELEFFALINIKPSEGNYEMEILSAEIKQKIRIILEKLIV